jgi:hypothetical protein
MSRPSTQLAARAGGILGFSAMAFVGWALGEKNLSPNGSPPSASPAHSETRIQGTGRPVDSNAPGDVQRKLNLIRQAASPEERMRATLELAMNLPTSEIAAWLEGRLFEVGDGYELTLFNKILKERWKAEDPGGLVAWHAKDRSGFATGMLAEWAAKEPQQVLDFLRERAEPGLALQALTAIAGKDSALAAKGLLEIASNCVSESQNYQMSELMKKLAATAPDALGNMLDALPPAIRAKGERALIQKRLTESFAGELPRLATHPDGLKIFSESLQENPSLRDHLLDNIGSIPPSWRHALAVNSSSFVSSQPEKWLNADLQAAGFSAEDARNIRSRALKRIASRKPQEALALLDSLGLPPDERAAMQRNIEAYTQNSNSNEGEKRPKVADQPGDWLKQVADINPQNGNQYAYYSELRKWDAGRIAELGKQFDTLTQAQKTAVANNLAQVSSDLDPALVNKAIEHLVTVPVDPELRRQGRAADPVSLASNHAVQWSKNDPDAASAWVNRLPASEAKTWAQKNLAANWIKYDYEEAQRWIKALPANERKEVETYIKQGPKR